MAGAGRILLGFRLCKIGVMRIVRCAPNLSRAMSSNKIVIKTAEDIAHMRVACRLAAEVLDELAEAIRPGITTAEIDRLAAECMKRQGSVSATIGYQPPNYPPYPGHVCTSVNHVVCHGIPGPKALKKGDIVNVDVTVIKDGYHGDTSRMFIVGGEGAASILARRLVNITFESMWRGIACVRPGARLGDIGHAIQHFAEGNGFSVVREYCGHGVGRKFHEAPQVLHYGLPNTGVELVPGMIFTIEPMLNAGKRDISTLADGWTVVTRDRSLSAQWEHAVLVTETGCEVLTLSEHCPPPPPEIAAKLPQFSG